MSSAVLRQEGQGPVPPVHIAIIMDGNRRWARARNEPPIFGHRQGAESVRVAVESCRRAGVRYLTLYAFSSENWRRPQDEVEGLMNLLRFYLRREISELDKNGIRLQAIGEIGALPEDIRSLIEYGEERTRHHVNLTVTFALNYGSRQEIVRAARLLASDACSGEIDIDAIDEAAIGSRLFTRDLPDPDLLIRTSGEQRISNFLLWQLAYTELVFVPVLWPEFREEHLNHAIDEFQRRERRYGAAAG